MQQRQHTIYLSLGSNLGDRHHFLQQAINLIDKQVGSIKKIAPVYQTPAIGFIGNHFLNTCVQIATFLSPEELIVTLLSIEQKLGRKRNDKGDYCNRKIDIDILFFNDKVLSTEILTIPHPRILDRKFVLIPLSDIAPNFIHPIEKKTVFECLKDCNDFSDIDKIEQSLIKPVLLSEKYNYIAIEGNIGAGKTSLANLMGQDLNAKVVLERFADNPFLPKFYQDRERYAFPLEMSFLADRYQQLTDDLAQYDLFKNCIISDYYIFKSLIFAQITLPREEYALYRKMFDIMYKEITKPNLYIYLYQNTTRLLENIKKRGRDYEQNIETDYLQKVHNGYINFIKTEQNLNVLIIDISNYDFVNNKTHYQKIIDIIKNKPTY